VLFGGPSRRAQFAVGDPIFFQYDAANQVIGITDRNLRQRDFTYNDLGLMCAGPNCGRSCCRIKGVWILEPQRAICRIGENFGEEVGQYGLASVAEFARRIWLHEGLTGRVVAEFARRMWLRGDDGPRWLPNSRGEFGYPA
jgi:YD repeat-containing protein